MDLKLKISLLFVFLVGSLSFAQSNCVQPESITNLKKCTNIRIFVGVTPGGASDVFARDLQQLLSKNSLTAIVENKPGASGHIASHQLLESSDKNCTFMMGTGASLALNSFNPELKPKLDPQASYEPIGLIASNPLFLVINKEKVKARTITEFLENSKKKSSFFATPGIGSTNHFTTVLLSELIKDSSFEHVPTKGASEAQLLLLSGEVDFVFDNPTTIKESERVMVLGNTSEKEVSFNGKLIQPIGHNLNTKSFFGLVATKGIDLKYSAGMQNFLMCLTKNTDFRNKYEAMGFHIESGEANALSELTIHELKVWKPIAAKIFQQ